MRQPTPQETLYRMHRSALRYRAVKLARGAVAARRMALAEPGFALFTDGEPECGWWRRKFVRNGPWVPVRIWLDQQIDPDTGELLAPETLRCLVGGEPANPEHHWQRCMGHPITEAEYERLLALHRGDPTYRATHAAVDLTLCTEGPER